MLTQSPLFTNLILAGALGLAVAVVIWLLRPYEVGRRIRLSLLGMGITAALYLVLLGLDIDSGSNLLKAILAVGLLLGANALLQLLDLIVWDYFLSQRRHLSMPRLLIDVFNVTFMLAAALIILNRVFAVDLSALLVTSTVVSAVIGLALQDTLGNVVAGLALQIDRPFDISHWIRVDEHEGEVVRMNWRTITIRAIDNQHITFANSNMARLDITNFSRPSQKQRMHVKIGLPYGTPPAAAKEALLTAARGAEGVLETPKPDVLIEEYGDSAIIYDVRYWIDDFEMTPETRDAVLTRIWYLLRRADITVPFPIRDVNLHQISEATEQRAAAQLHQEIYTLLRGLDLFGPLTDEQIDQMAAGSILEKFDAGESLVCQGDKGDSLFVIKSGKVNVDLERPDGRVMTVTDRTAGEFFGEMSLLTGESRSASVIATEEVTVVIVNRDALANVISGDLSSLKALSEVVAHRLQEAAERLANADEKATAQAQAKAAEASLLTRIRGFLGVRRSD